MLAAPTRALSPGTSPPRRAPTMATPSTSASPATTSMSATRRSHRRGLRLGNRAGPSTPKGLFRKSSRLCEFSGGVARRATNDDEDDRPSWSASSDAEKNAASSNPKPKKQKPITPMTGMGTRYLDVEEISDASLAIAFVLAVASAVAVGYLVFTAPNKDSPQFQRRDGLDAVKLGVVDEVGEAPNVA